MFTAQPPRHGSKQIKEARRGKVVKRSDKDGDLHPMQQKQQLRTYLLAVAVQ
jgi:hypothetical protein